MRKKKPLYHLTDDSTLCGRVHYTYEWQNAAASMSADLEKNKSLVGDLEYAFQCRKSMRTQSVPPQRSAFEPPSLLF